MVGQGGLLISYSYLTHNVRKNVPATYIIRSRSKRARALRIRSASPSCENYEFTSHHTLQHLTYPCAYPFAFVFPNSLHTKKAAISIQAPDLSTRPSHMHTHPSTSASAAANLKNPTLLDAGQPHYAKDLVLVWSLEPPVLDRASVLPPDARQKSNPKVDKSPQIKSGKKLVVRKENAKALLNRMLYAGSIFVCPVEHAV